MLLIFLTEFWKVRKRLSLQNLTNQCVNMWKKFKITLKLWQFYPHFVTLLLFKSQCWQKASRIIQICYTFVDIFDQLFHAPFCPPCPALRIFTPTHSHMCAYIHKTHTYADRCTHYTDADQIESTFIGIVARPLSITQPRSEAWVRLAVIIYQLIPKRK